MIGTITWMSPFKVNPDGSVKVVIRLEGLNNAKSWGRFDLRDNAAYCAYMAGAVVGQKARITRTIFEPLGDDWWSHAGVASQETDLECLGRDAENEDEEDE